MQADVPRAFVIYVGIDGRDNRDYHCSTSRVSKDTVEISRVRLTVDDAVDESEVEGDELDYGLFGEEHERAEEGTDNKVRIEAAAIVSTPKWDARYVCAHLVGWPGFSNVVRTSLTGPFSASICLRILFAFLRSKTGAYAARIVSTQARRRKDEVDGLSGNAKKEMTSMMPAAILVDQNTQRHVDRSAIQPPATGPMAGPSRGASEYTAIALPRSSGLHMSPRTAPPH